MSEKCAWCDFLKDSHKKIYHKKIGLEETLKCPDCGAWSNAWKTTIMVNSYEYIYLGCIELMKKLIGDVEKFLQENYPDELADMVEKYGDNGCEDEEKKLLFNYCTNDILLELFMPHCADINAINMKTLLGIKEECVEFSIRNEQKEDISKEKRQEKEHKFIEKKEVSREEFEEFIKNYPRVLVKNCFMGWWSWHDFSISENCFECIVAKELMCLYGEKPIYEIAEEIQ